MPLAMVMRRLPAISKTKDKQRHQNLGAHFDKLFFNELSTKLILPEIDHYELRPVTIDGLVELIKDGLNASVQAKTDGSREQEIAAALISWLLNCSVQASEPASVPVNPQVVKVEPTENVADTPAVSTSPVETNAPKTSPQAADSAPDWRAGVRQIQKYIEKQDDTIALLKEQISNQSRAADRANDEITALKKSAEKDASEIASLQTRIAELSLQLRKKTQEAENLSATLAEKEAEIEDRKRLADIISLDNTKQSEEVLRRLSGELASYYGDFVEAGDTEMTVEVGEILRDQLSDIYKILKKNGITL